MIGILKRIYRIYRLNSARKNIINNSNIGDNPIITDTASILLLSASKKIIKK